MRNVSLWARGLGAVFAVAALAGPAAAQETFPGKPIRIIVVESAGTSTDNVVRILAPGMSAILGQPLVVEYKVGAGSVIGLEYVARQVPADVAAKKLLSMGRSFADIAKKAGIQPE